MMKRLTILLLVLPMLCFSQSELAYQAYRNGVDHYRSNNIDAAIQSAEQAIIADLNYVSAYHLLINCLEKKSAYEKLIKLYQKLITIRPEEKVYFYNLSLIYIKTKDFETAQKCLNRALDIDPFFTKAELKLDELIRYISNRRSNDKADTDSNVQTEVAVYNQALELYNSKKYRECLNELDQFNKVINNPDFYYLKAITFHALEDRHNCMLNYFQTLKLDDLHYKANLNLGKMYYNDHEFFKAKERFLKIQGTAGDDVQLLLAKSSYFAKDYKFASEYFEDYIQTNPNDQEAWNLLYKSYEKQGNDALAKQSKAQLEALLVQSKPKSSHAEKSDLKSRWNAAIKSSKDGNYINAIEILENAIKIYPRESSLSYNLGLNYYKINNIKKAVSNLEYCLSIDKLHAKAYQALGKIYYEKEDFSMAGAYYLEALEAGKKDEFLLYKLGSCYFKLNRFEEAIGYYKKAITLNPSQEHYYFSLGLSYLSLKDHQNSIQSFEQLLKLNPEHIDAMYHLCINYAESGQYQKCIDKAQSILLKDRDYAPAYLIIAHVYKKKAEYQKSDEYYTIAVRLDPSLKH